jgi:hypothetical protein
VTQSWSAKRLAQALARQVARRRGGHMAEAAKLLEQRLKWVLDRPTMRRASAATRLLYYRQAGPTAVGAPPRKLSGLGLRSVRVVARGSVLVVSNAARSRRGFFYMMHHEGTTYRPGLHRWVAPTVVAFWHDLRRLGVTRVITM